MQPVLRLPAQPPLASGGFRRLRCFSTGGLTVGLVICGFNCLFIFLPVMLPSVLPRLSTDSAVRIFPGVWKLLFKTPFPGWSSVPPFFVSFFCLLYFLLPPFEDNVLLFWMPAGIQKLFCGLHSGLNVLLMSLRGRKCSPRPTPLPS